MQTSHLDFVCCQSGRAHHGCSISSCCRLRLCGRLGGGGGFGGCLHQFAGRLLLKLLRYSWSFCCQYISSHQWCGQTDPELPTALVEVCLMGYVETGSCCNCCGCNCSQQYSGRQPISITAVLLIYFEGYIEARSCCNYWGPDLDYTAADTAYGGRTGFGWVGKSNIPTGDGTAGAGLLNATSIYSVIFWQYIIIDWEWSDINDIIPENNNKQSRT